MTNLPINNSTSMNQHYLAPDREKPAADKTRDPLLSKAFSDAVKPDNGTVLKDSNVMVNRDALERLFDMFESAFRAIRSMLAGQGGLPKPMPEAGALRKDLNADPTLNSDNTQTKLPKRDPKSTATSQTDPKLQLLSDAASKVLANADAQAKVSTDNKHVSTSTSEQATKKTESNATSASKETKADAKLLSEIASSVLPNAGELLKEASKAQPELHKSLSNNLSLMPDAQTFKTSPTRDVPVIKQDAAQQNKQTSDVNVTVQVINCGFHHPDLSSKRNGVKAADIFGGFRQGPDGNCVTVSAIKVAMAKFGQSPTDIFKEVRKERDGYQVTMRDGYTLYLSQRELYEGAQASRFVGRDKEMLKDAHFLFAVSAKRAQLENNDGFAALSFTDAVLSLNDGEDEYGPGEGLLRLGLSRHIESVPVSELANGELGMVNRRGHSVAVIEGVEEVYGKRGRSPRRGEAVALR